MEGTQGLKKKSHMLGLQRNVEDWEGPLRIEGLNGIFSGITVLELKSVRYNLSRIWKLPFRLSDTSYLGSASCCRPASAHQARDSGTHHVREGGCCRAAAASGCLSHSSRCMGPTEARSSTHHQLQSQHSHTTV